jgi:hypothetical protein
LEDISCENDIVMGSCMRAVDIDTVRQSFSYFLLECGARALAVSSPTCGTHRGVGKVGPSASLCDGR